MKTIKGRLNDGRIVYYTGKAGPGWVSVNESDAFPMGVEWAKKFVTYWNQFSALNGVVWCDE